ncbi:MAG: four helix bundle protein [Gemmatimonadaceae bacterium]
MSHRLARRDNFSGMHDYHRLLVWKKAHSVAVAIHRLTGRMARRYNADLINQMRRAALSIPSNIADGSNRPTDLDFARFLQIALASATELEYHLEFAADTALIDRAQFTAHQAELVEIRKMLVGLIRRMKSTDAKRQAV